MTYRLREAAAAALEALQFSLPTSNRRLSSHARAAEALRAALAEKCEGPVAWQDEFGECGPVRQYRRLACAGGVK